MWQTFGDDVPYRISFNHGSPRLIVAIVERLAEEVAGRSRGDGKRRGLHHC